MLFRSLESDKGDGLDGSCIDDLLQRIDDETNRDILLMWLHGSSLIEIAHALQLPPGTVRRRWGVLRAEMCEFLQGRGQP